MGLVAQFVKQYTGYLEVNGSIPFQTRVDPYFRK